MGVGLNKRVMGFDWATAGQIEKFEDTGPLSDTR